MGRRHYEIGTDKLPSVTTILSQTQSEEKKKSLANWRPGWDSRMLIESGIYQR